jgi:DNA-binding NarL/FixJ family response regulator
VAVWQGQIWASINDELRQVLSAFAKSSKQPKMDSSVENRITKREAEVVRLVGEGLSNREIGQRLGLTEHTVKNYLVRVFDKLGVSNRVELARVVSSFAMTLGGGPNAKNDPPP